jgi:outer membrane murein-binding lipoprotein Lpp
MKHFTKNRRAVVMLAAVALSSLVITGCTKYATEEELAALDKTNAEISKINKEISDCNAKNAEVKSKISAAETNVKRLQDEKAFVEQGLSTFNPAAFDPKPVEVPKKGAKKKK